MSTRIVTAVYRTAETAELVRDALVDVGVPPANIHLIPDPAGRRAAEGSTEAAFDEVLAELDSLHELDLPEDEISTYEKCVRHGDFVVSAEVEEKRLEEAQTAMRRPESEAHHIQRRAAELPDAAGGSVREAAERRRRRRVHGDEDPYIRTYQYEREERARHGER